MLSKNDARKALKQKLSSLESEFFTAEGKKAAALLVNEKIFAETETLLLFMSMKDEIDTGPILDLGLSAHKKVFVPRVEGGDIRFYRILSVSGPWERGPWGIREPRPELPLAKEDFPVLALVPGLGFDNRGRRLGHGRGYYDRFFAGLSAAFPPCPRFFALGYCTSVQLVPELPVDPWDPLMDGLCTGRECTLR
jgi:5-formyltetrahydrofolate cyclo-ligase